MCGIAGILNFEGKTQSAQALYAMLETIKHRGPDGEGMEAIHGLILGHRRLSIIDLSGGAQPMYSHDRKYLLSFNGEIFNFVELREECETRGSRFTTKSDTEVILECFRHFGVEALSKLNGQFALALYDIESRTLYLSRDRLGEKPFYYYKSSSHLVFASELKAIIKYKQLAGLDLKLNAQAMWGFLSLNYVPFDETMLQGVKCLPPGTCLRIDGSGTKELRYWNGDVAVRERSSETATKQLQLLLADAAKIRLRSDVPVGIFLSGGIDSTCIAIAAAKHSKNLKAFVAHFQEAGFSEAPQAIETCRQLGLPHELVEISFNNQDIPALIERLVSHGDEPLADSSALPVFLLSQATAKSLKVVLSGDGGDELFGGYLTYKATMLARYLPPPVRKFLYRKLNLVRMLPAGDAKVGMFEKLERFVRNLSLPPGAAHFAWNGMFASAEKHHILHPEFLRGQVLADTFLQMAEELQVDLERPGLKQLMRADQDGYLCHDILAKADRMSMAHGLEVRPVFMDHRIVEYSRSLERQHQFCGFQGKVVLREWLEEVAPWYSLTRPKLGFSIPIHLWFRTKLQTFAYDLFNSEFVRQSGIYNQQYLLKLFEQHRSRQRNLGFELWGIMVSLLWCKRFGVKRA